MEFVLLSASPLILKAGNARIVENKSKKGAAELSTKMIWSGLLGHWGVEMYDNNNLHYEL